jgi:hypothetical protein
MEITTLFKGLSRKYFRLEASGSKSGDRGD